MTPKKSVSAVKLTAAQTSVAENDKPRWTVMVLMGAERVPGSSDLVLAARDDIAEMENLFLGSPGGFLNLFVQVHGDGEPRRLDIGAHEEYLVDEAEQDATNGNALIAFMRWAFNKAGRTDHSLLVLWGHAFEFAIGRAVTRTGIDALDFGELADILERFKREEKQTLDILGFDACDLATVEIAYQFRHFAHYLLASEIGIPIPGWPYDRVLDRIKDPKGRQMGPAELGSYIVRRYCEAYQADQLTVSLTLLDLAQSQRLVQLTENLARRLAFAMAEDAGELDLVFRLFARSQTIEDKPFVDVADLCLNLFRNSGDPAVRTAAERLGDFLISPHPVIPDQSETGKGRPFVVEHGRNACQTAKLHGVSLYAPHVEPGFDVDAAAGFYDKLAFTKETLWNDVVRALAQAI